MRTFRPPQWGCSKLLQPHFCIISVPGEYIREGDIYA